MSGDVKKSKPLYIKFKNLLLVLFFLIILFIFYNAIKAIKDYRPYDLYCGDHRVVSISSKKAALRNICLWHGSSYQIDSPHTPLSLMRHSITNMFKSKVNNFNISSIKNSYLEFSVAVTANGNFRNITSKIKVNKGVVKATNCILLDTF